MRSNDMVYKVKKTPLEMSNNLLFFPIQKIIHYVCDTYQSRGEKRTQEFSVPKSA